MKNFCILSDALEYIEANLQIGLTQEEIARACACSLSSLQKLFSYCFHLGVADYITKRRMTNSARELIGGESVIDTAVVMRAGAIKFDKSNLRYLELYADLSKAVLAARERNDMFAFAN